MKKLQLIIGALLVSINSFSTTSGKNLVWEETGNILTKSITGPMALAFGTICIVGAALAWAMSQHGEGMGKGLRIAIALAIAFGAPSIVVGLYGFSSSTIIF
jgi:type IV secretory pathway VirB2 component (pilin)